MKRYENEFFMEIKIGLRDMTEDAADILVAHLSGDLWRSLDRSLETGLDDDLAKELENFWN